MIWLIMVNVCVCVFYKVPMWVTSRKRMLAVCWPTLSDRFCMTWKWRMACLRLATLKRTFRLWWRAPSLRSTYHVTSCRCTKNATWSRISAFSKKWSVKDHPSSLITREWEKYSSLKSWTHSAEVCLIERKNSSNNYNYYLIFVIIYLWLILFTNMTIY